MTSVLSFILCLSSSVGLPGITNLALSRIVTREFLWERSVAVGLTSDPGLAQHQGKYLETDAGQIQILLFLDHGTKCVWDRIRLQIRSSFILAPQNNGFLTDHCYLLNLSSRTLTEKCWCSKELDSKKQTLRNRYVSWYVSCFEWVKDHRIHS